MRWCWCTFLQKFKITLTPTFQVLNNSAHLNKAAFYVDHYSTVFILMLITLHCFEPDLNCVCSLSGRHCHGQNQESSVWRSDRICVLLTDYWRVITSFLFLFSQDSQTCGNLSTFVPFIPMHIQYIMCRAFLIMCLNRVFYPCFLQLYSWRDFAGIDPTSGKVFFCIVW